ncbi:hypothetical protein GCK72_000275 [Caenorhabditis remanei]|uniref:F-box domain-containing protein n=1 Tax=Caenorhabditis remanei TaxID=31234 RepID=A0A6A5HQC5_CAERE|nr:hypothetical protein GCK72_000275 [Caenorhabditis remanei]KAF1768463.1 hypothetical protein GCK72_000275 [Caenorhabditis remanei]
MSFIPLFKLPVLCINNILSNMDTISLVSLSLISKRSKRLVRTTKTSLTGFNIEIKNDVTQVQFVTSEKEDAGNWFFKIEEKECIDDQVMEMSFKDDTIHSYHSPNDIQQSVKLGVEYLRDLFKKPVIKVYLFPNAFKASKRPFYVGFNECDNLFIEGEKEIKNEDLKSILETLQVKTRLILNIPVNSSFECNTNLLEFKRLTCSYKVISSRWITREVLMSLKCTHMQFHHTLLEADDIMSFFERWYHSDDTQFTILLVKTDKSFAGMNLDRFNPTQWNPEQRGPKFLYSSDIAFECTAGVDIMRKDSLLCTVDNRINVLIFAVWHNRFPDVSGVS